MDLSLPEISQLIEHVDFPSVMRAFLLLVIGFVLATVISSIIGRFFAGRTSIHYAVLLKRTSYYGILFMMLLMVLETLHFNMDTILGAAGIFSLAVGFAARVPIANLISHLSLVLERPFVIGDFLDIDGTVGEVIAIELLAVRLRTRDNKLMRIPNEHLIQNPFINLTRFPIRRIDVPIRIGYDTPIQNVEKILMEVAEANPLSLESPPPKLLFESFEESFIKHNFTLWVKIDSFLDLKHSLPSEIQQAMIKHKISIPYPRTNVELERHSPQ